MKEMSLAKKRIYYCLSRTLLVTTFGRSYTDSPTLGDMLHISLIGFEEIKNRRSRRVIIRWQAEQKKLS